LVNIGSNFEILKLKCTSRHEGLLFHKYLKSYDFKSLKFSSDKYTGDDGQMKENKIYCTKTITPPLRFGGLNDRKLSKKH